MYLISRSVCQLERLLVKLPVQPESRLTEDRLAYTICLCLSISSIMADKQPLLRPPPDQEATAYHEQVR